MMFKHGQRGVPTASYRVDPPMHCRNNPCERQRPLLVGWRKGFARRRTNRVIARLAAYSRSHERDQPRTHRS